MALPGAIPGVLDVEILRGPSAPADQAPDLLVEVPHGADRRAHYDALRARLVGDLPADLDVFFSVNTDVGAWQLGRRIAEHVLARRPGSVAIVLRCLVPRTFIDCNRLEDATDDLAAGGVTAGLAPYIRHQDDRALLLGLHRQYVAAADAAFQAVCGAGGFALIPHTYGPVSLGIPRVDDDIVVQLRAAHAPGVVETWPVRPEVDCLTRTADGVQLAPEGAAARVRDALAGIDVAECATYALVPATQGYRWATRHPGRTFTWEVRRDLLVAAWTWDREMEVDPVRVERLAAPLAAVVSEWLDAAPA